MNRDSLLLMVFGVAVNVIGVRIALFFELPLFLDSIGTILAAALGGYLPGIMVGFFSNLINGASDPITLYYGIVSVLLAAAAAFFAQRGVFRSLGKTLASVPVFTLLGGGVGSLLTWLLYGFNFGTGISAPYAQALHLRLGLPRFGAQLAADLGIDLADKLLTVLLVYLILRLLPDGFRRRFAYGRFHAAAGPGEERRFYRRYSLRSEVVGLIAVVSVILGSLATTIGYVVYRDTMEQRYIESAVSAAELMLHTVDADAVDGYLAGGEETAAYLAAEAELEDLCACLGNIRYMYVYQIREDGCHVVFDVDTPETPGGSLGDVVEVEPAFLPHMDTLLAGGEIEPVISNGAYGWLLTVYRPLRDSAGRCVAYAAADVDMNAVITDRYVFIIRMASLLFGASMILVALTIWFAERRVVLPINAMSGAAGEFAYDSEAERLRSVEEFRKLNIRTGDELESLYESLAKLVEDMGVYISDIGEKAAVIAAMQSSMIVSFAEMVENRDENTGEHIRHTAGYVRAIAEELRRRGAEGAALTDADIEDLVRSAPLHDIGKIKISDVLLNKPGKLTPEEFEVMKTHARAGREILEHTMQNVGSAGYLATARDMAAFHHERWDGTGYPERLAGREIPLCARIMAVADVFDALISKRSYKEPMAVEEAFAVIRAESGSHFDPAVVEAFFAARARIRALAAHGAEGEEA